MTKRKFLWLVSSLAVVLFLFQLGGSCLRTQAIAQKAFENYCAEQHRDPYFYKMAYDKVELLGHYWDYCLTIKDYPGQMGFYRVYVTWLGTSQVTVFKGLPR